jgi:ATP-dependent helicase HrpA
LSAWDGHELPHEVILPTGIAYPALVDETTCIGIRAFASREEATESHRAGLARLLCLTQPTQADHLLKHYPIDPVIRIGLPSLGSGGTAVDDLILLAAEGALGGAQPRSPDAFGEVAAHARGEWFVAADAIAAHLLATIGLLHEIQDWMADHRDHRHLGSVVDDLDEQFTWLFRARFAWHAGFRRLADYPRYLRAVRSRLGRLKSLPIIKDLEKMERMQPLWSSWMNDWTAAPDDPAAWEAGWLLQEWRVSLFAPDVPAAARISEKRLTQILENLREQRTVTRRRARHGE